MAQLPLAAPPTIKKSDIMNLIRFVCCINFLFLALPLTAHEAWIELEGPDHVIIYGHSAEGQAYDPDKIKKVKAYSTAGEEIEVALEPASGHVKAVPAKGAILLTLDFDNGFWSEMDGEFRNEAKTLTGASEGSRSLKFGKTVLSWDEQITKPVGQLLEIVPLNPTLIQKYDQVAVQVLYKGKPLADAKVHAGGEHGSEVLIGDKLGIVRVPVVSGPQRITTSYRIPYSGPEADFTNLSANLYFSAP